MSTRVAYILAGVVTAFILCASSQDVETAVEHASPFRLTGDGRINLYDVHTGENLSIVYRDREGRYRISTLDAVDRVLRCHGDQEEYPISLKLVELIDHLQDHFGAGEVRVVSGYRSPEYNAALKRKMRRVAHDSLHMRGWAMDIQFPEVGKQALGDYARSLGSGGVGVYASSSFVHIDVGPVRSW